MNRRERRNLEKRLGLQKHMKTLTREEKFERIRQNIIEGKKKEEEMKETVRVMQGGDKDKVDNNKIASMATDLMIKEGMSYIDALEKAKELYQKELEAAE